MPWLLFFILSPNIPFSTLPLHLIVLLLPLGIKRPILELSTQEHGGVDRSQGDDSRGGKKEGTCKRGAVFRRIQQPMVSSKNL
jgi:hypothetical protein